MVRMSNDIDWLDQWLGMMCDKMPVVDQGDYERPIKCSTPDGIVSCDQCRYGYKED